MTCFRLEPAADRRLDEIYAYTTDRWGEDQAIAYIRELFAAFEAIVAREVTWRRIPAELGVDGYFRRCGEHVIYWKSGTDDTVLIVAILHKRMHQVDRLREALDE